MRRPEGTPGPGSVVSLCWLRPPRLPSCAAAETHPCQVVAWPNVSLGSSSVVDLERARRARGNTLRRLGCFAEEAVDGSAEQTLAGMSLIAMRTMDCLSSFADFRHPQDLRNACVAVGATPRHLVGPALPMDLGAGMPVSGSGSTTRRQAEAIDAPRRNVAMRRTSWDIQQAPCRTPEPRLDHVARSQFPG